MKQMKQIDKYVDSVYQNAKGDKKEIEELKLEMKNHLLESVNELIESGKTEEAAIDIAIGRVGEEKEMRSAVAKLFVEVSVMGKERISDGEIRSFFFSFCLFRFM